jgi:rhodanese-related sulfurtransferase
MPRDIRPSLAFLLTLSIAIVVRGASTAPLTPGQGVPAPPRIRSTLTTSTTTAPAGAVSKAYCGIRCLYAAAIAQGLQIDGMDLIRPEYVGSREGSSINELTRAAADHGLHTFPFVDGTIAMLRRTTHPVLLHVESTPASGQYDHFVLYLGTRGNNLLILDPASETSPLVRSVDPASIAFIWDSTGLIVSLDPIKARDLAGSVLPILGWGTVLAIAILGIKHWRRPGRLPLPAGAVSPTLWLEITAILLTSLLAPPLWALCTHDGPLAQAEQLRLTEQGHLAQFMPRMAFADAQRAIASHSTLFVDARYAADYSAGHLPGAINLPITYSIGLLRARLVEVSADRHIVVYCQSRGCPLAKTVAGNLMRAGFNSVQLLDGGWEEWSKWSKP